MSAMPTGSGPAGRLPLVDGALSTLARRLSAPIAAHPRAKLSLDRLTELAIGFDPSLAASTDRRQRLAQAIDELCAAQLVRRPSTASYDRASTPHLPRFLWLVRHAEPSPRTQGHTVAWRPELAWAGGLRLTDEQLQLLVAVNRFLRDSQQRPTVPIRERSLQLLGDEKRLEALLAGPLFAPGRLTLDLLRCEIVRPPFVVREIGPGTTLLVVENHTTFHTLARHLAETGDIGLIAYGAGRQFEASVSYIADLPRDAQRVLYFGDLDDPGLSIAANAARSAKSLELPAIEPAVGLYQLLIQYGRRAPWERPSARARARRLSEWLPGDLRPPVIDLLLAGERLAQEAVGVEALARAGDIVTGHHG